MNEAEAIVEVVNSQGIHVRTSAIIASAAIHFLSATTISCGSATADARSAVELVALGVGPGEQVKIYARGRDAEAAVAAIRKLFEDKFGED